MLRTSFRLVIMRMRHLSIAWSLAIAACGESKAPEPATQTHHEAPRIAVQWAGTASIYDVLGRDTTSVVPRLIQVPLRQLPKGLTLQLPEPGSLPVRLVTQCDAGYCVDGIVAEHRLVDGLLPPKCGVRVDESAIVNVQHPDGVCHFVRRPDLSADEAEVLDGDGSWLERGIALRYASGAWVSFLEGTAWFTAGAAHSHAKLTCRTHGALGPSSLRGGFFADHEVAAIASALDAFFTEQREAYDDRASGLVVDRAVLEDSVLLEGPRSVVVCAGRDPDEGVLQLVRVTLPDKLASR